MLNDTEEDSRRISQTILEDILLLKARPGVADVQPDPQTIGTELSSSINALNIDLQAMNSQPGAMHSQTYSVIETSKR